MHLKFVRKFVLKYEPPKYANNTQKTWNNSRFFANTRKWFQVCRPWIEIESFYCYFFLFLLVFFSWWLFFLVLLLSVPLDNNIFEAMVFSQSFCFYSPLVLRLCRWKKNEDFHMENVCHPNLYIFGVSRFTGSKLCMIPFAHLTTTISELQSISAI